MAGKKSSTMTREQAAELYRDLRKAMGTLQQRKLVKAAPDKGTQDIAKTIAQSISKSMAKDGPVTPAMRSFVQEETQDAVARMAIARDESGLNAGHYAALTAVLAFAFFKVVLSGLEASGLASATPVQASQQMAAQPQAVDASAPRLSREEVRILTSLDARRAELEDRRAKLEERERDLSRREKESVGKLQQLRELTDRLKLERERSEKKRDTQIEQLANVYGSMAPQEAAALMEQLDITIALPLMERMPEKRIGQILALMTRERALAVTKLLSGKGAEK